VLRQARTLGLRNFSVLCNHVLTPPAMRGILGPPPGNETSAHLHGFIGPAHVSTVIGSEPYRFCADEYHRPVVITGFEPLDVMQAVLMLVRQLNEGRADIENQFTRSVTPLGNQKAQALMREVFELRESFEWRGLGSLPHSALKLRPDYAGFDAEQRFAAPYRAVADAKACECGAILRGEKRPQDCRVFGTVCTPENPIGSCMVSSEGACAAHYTYGRFMTAMPSMAEMPGAAA
jgi:hydrogenase expression/formation protein HypD